MPCAQGAAGSSRPLPLRRRPNHYGAPAVGLMNVVPTARGALVDAPLERLRAAAAQHSNSALQSRTNHRAPALLPWCNALLREVLWWALWWGSLDGMQGVRGSNPLSSTRHNASHTSALGALAVGRWSCAGATAS